MVALRTQSVRSLERGLTLLELLANSRTGFSLPELVKKTELPKSSIHCLLVTLERRGYLHRNIRTGRYLFGLQLFTLANMAVSGLKLHDEAAPFLRSLVKGTELTAHMAILEQREAILVSKFEPQGISRLATWIGKRMDLHCTSLGKALLAYLPPQEVDEIIRVHGLPRHNDNTLCSRRRLGEDLVKTVERGYALDDEEDELGLRCVGAPIFGPDNHVMASISIAGTADQITPANIHKLGEQVKQTAAMISARFGHNSTASPASE